MSTSDILKFFSALIVPLCEVGVPLADIRDALQQLVEKDKLWEYFGKLTTSKEAVKRYVDEIDGDIFRGIQ